MCVVNHNWSATKQCLYLQSVAEISRHSVLTRTGFDNVRHRLCLATRTEISVCKSPFPSAGTKCYYFTFGCWNGSSICLHISLSVCLSVCNDGDWTFVQYFCIDCEENTTKVSTTVSFQISLDCHTIIMNTCISDSFARDVCVCVYVLKTIADVCSYVDWRKISGEFKCLDQGHYMTL